MNTKQRKKSYGSVLTVRALMDPLSIALGTLTLLGALGTTVKGLRRLASLRDAPTQVLQLCSEVSAF